MKYIYFPIEWNFEGASGDGLGGDTVDDPDIFYICDDEDEDELTEARLSEYVDILIDSTTPANDPDGPIADQHRDAARKIAENFILQARRIQERCD